MASEILYVVGLLHFLLSMIAFVNPYLHQTEFFYSILTLYNAGKKDVTWNGLYNSIK